MQVSEVFSFQIFRLLSRFPIKNFRSLMSSHSQIEDALDPACENDGRGKFQSNFWFLTLARIVYVGTTGDDCSNDAENRRV